MGRLAGRPRKEVGASIVSSNAEPVKRKALPEENLSPGDSSRLALRPHEAARALGISERALWSITADKSSGIPHTRLGRSVLYPTDLLREWLAKQVKTEGACR